MYKKNSATNFVDTSKHIFNVKQHDNYFLLRNFDKIEKLICGLLSRVKRVKKFQSRT